MNALDMQACARQPAAQADKLAGKRRQDAAARELAHALRARIAVEVRFDGGSRSLYATDHSIYRHVPIGMVIPRRSRPLSAVCSAVPTKGRTLSTATRLSATV